MRSAFLVLLALGGCPDRDYDQWVEITDAYCARNDEACGEVVCELQGRSRDCRIDQDLFEPCLEALETTPCVTYTDDPPYLTPLWPEVCNEMSLGCEDVRPPL